MAADTGKLSFAKVAASATKMDHPAAGSAGARTGSDADAEHAVARGLAALRIGGLSAVVADGSVSTAGVSPANQTTPPSSDEVSQRADSSSELGTKPPSLDGKSITSGTTFNALDEKDSLRPDDSASVKAAADEDDAFSIRGSLLVTSRLGSDVAARVHRIQIGDMPPRALPLSGPQEPATAAEAAAAATAAAVAAAAAAGAAAAAAAAGAGGAGGGLAPAEDDSSSNGMQAEARALALAAPSSSCPQQPVTEARVQLATSTAPPGGVLTGQNPDEKLLDAMQTPKDRLFLLRLENDVVNFVQNSKEPFMDLPPSNSFCRMLTHKLADYYHMTHSFEAVAGAVRIYRTPFCRVPPPLASFVAAHPPPASSSPPPLVVQPKKIMRRGEDGDIPVSAAPSKPTSEAGSDPKDKAPLAKEKLSREAREEAYNKARERIFKSSMPTEASTPENDDSTGISRASSVSAKDRANNSGKKGKTGKQRRDDSESFDSRSQYTPYYHHPQQATWVPPQFVPVAAGPYSAAPPRPPPQMPQMPQQPPPPPYAGAALQPQIAYGASPAAYPSVAPSSSHGPPPVAGVPIYPPPTGPVHHMAPGALPVFAYGPAGQPQPAAVGQPWQQQQQPPPPPPPPAPQPFYHAAPGYPARPGPPPAGMAGYPFGQLPGYFNPSDPTKGQHPIPGSYAGTYLRHGFNPKTQSFVPGTGPMAAGPMPIHPPTYGGGGGGSGPIPIGPAGGSHGHGHGHGHRHGSFSQNTPPYSNGGFPQSGLSTSPYGGSTTSSYGMMRQGSGSSASAYASAAPPAPRQAATAYLQHHHRDAAVPYGSPPSHLPGPPPHHGAHPRGQHGQHGQLGQHGQHGHLHLPPSHGGPVYAPGLHGAPRGPSHHQNNKAAGPRGPKKPNGLGGPPPPLQQQQPPPPQGPKASASTSSTNSATSQAYGNLPNYGNPATLPQKPTSA